MAKYYIYLLVNDLQLAKDRSGLEKRQQKRHRNHHSRESRLQEVGFTCDIVIPGLKRPQFAWFCS